MFPVIHGVLSQAVERGCKYPLDKTDFGDIPIPVIAAEPLDNSYQKFRVKAGMPPDEFQVAAPDGIEINPDSGGFIFPNRGVLGDSFIYAVKVKTSGAPRTIQLGIPMPYLSNPEEDLWAEIIPLTIESYTEGGVWSVRIGLPNPTRYILPDEFTVVVFSGPEAEGDTPCFTYIPELEVCDISGAIFGVPTIKGLKFGFLFLGSPQNEDYDVELITDKETIVGLIGDFDIPAATSYLVDGGVTKVETICGEVIDLNQPAGGDKPNQNHLTFSSDAPFSIKFNQKRWDGVLEYSTDAQNWYEWDASEISSANNVLYLRGLGNTRITGEYGATFRMIITSSSDVSCTGNVMSLLDYISPETAVMGEYCFASLFYYCQRLTTAPELPATTLNSGCYREMFRDCIRLTTAPELPATTLAPRCYEAMFQNCKGLTTAPELPATTLSSYCYAHMFYICTGLKISSTQEGIYQKPWRIPTTGTIERTYSGWGASMLEGTGGTFKGNPDINTTYYQAVDPAN